MNLMKLPDDKGQVSDEEARTNRKNINKEQQHRLV